MLEIREYRIGDEKGFQKLDSLVEEHPWNRRNLENWKWKFKGKNPAGESLMIYAENNSEIIGHFAAIPMKYWIDGKTVIASHSAAMMIDPKWQNKGLIIYIAEKLIKKIEDLRIPFTYGYPNNNAYDLHIKMLGYEEICQQKLFIKYIEQKEKTHDITIESKFWKKISRFGPETLELWEKSKNDYKAIVDRSPDFLNWRYLDRPDIDYFAYGIFDEYKLEGYIVMKIYREGKVLRGHIVDIFTAKNNTECASLLIQKGIEFFEKKKVSELTLWMQGSSSIKELLFKNGFAEGGHSGAGWPSSNRPMVCRFNSKNDNFQPFLNENDWYFTMGDTLEIY